MSKASPRLPKSQRAADPSTRGAEGRSADPREVAHYVTSMTGEMSSLAKMSGLDLLGYLLDMARLEAEKQANGED